MIQWDMIQEGDRLLLGLSGGKDSLSLLHCLLEFQRKLPIKFEIEVNISACVVTSAVSLITTPYFKSGLHDRPNDSII